MLKGEIRSMCACLVVEAEVQEDTADCDYEKDNNLGKRSQSARQEGEMRRSVNIQNH